MEELQQTVDALQQQILQLQQTQQQQILAPTQGGAGTNTLDLSPTELPTGWGSFNGSSPADGTGSPLPHRSGGSKRTKRKSLRIVATSVARFPMKASTPPGESQSPQVSPGSRPVASMLRAGEGKEVPPIVVGRHVSSTSRLSRSPRMSPFGRSPLRPGSDRGTLSSPHGVEAWGKMTDRGAESDPETEKECMAKKKEGVRRAKEEGEGSLKDGRRSLDVFLSPIN